MRLMAFATAMLGAAVLGAAGPTVRPAPDPAAPALHRPLGTIYDLYLGGIPIGELEIRATVEGGRYRAASRMRTAGVLGAFYEASFEAEAEGVVGPGGLVPRRFTADTRAGDDVQAVDMTYAGRTPAQVRAEPPFKPKPWEIAPRDQTGTLDPITAALTALSPAPAATLCRRTLDIFDGRRRWAVDLGRPEADGARIRCPAVYRRVAGYKPKELKETIDFSIWFEERPDGLAQPVRAAGDSMLGVAVVLLRE